MLLSKWHAHHYHLLLCTKSEPEESRASCLTIVVYINLMKHQVGEFFGLRVRWPLRACTVCKEKLNQGG